MLRNTLTAAAIMLATAGVAAAEDHQVQMLNRSDSGDVMVFEPAVLRIAPGDTVTFVPTAKGHNAESIADLVPEGAEGWKGKINQEVTITFDVEGVYAYKCTPHYATGMIGLIIVGDSDAGLEAIEKARFPGRSKQRRDEYVELARSMM
ncbi:MAG: pseudoazurin [Pseudomonadota bacterium]